MSDKKRTRIIAGIIVFILAVSGYISNSLTKRPNTDFTAVKRADITQGLSLNGVVVSSQDLSLAFEQGGTVSQILVKAGDHVKAGQILVKINGSAAAAAAAAANASLAMAQANYQKLINGATAPDVNVAQTALDSAKKNLAAVTAQQNQLVANAQSSLQNTGLIATPSGNNISSQNPTISGTYTGKEQGQYQIKMQSTGGGWQMSVSGLESYTAPAGNTGPVALGKLGLFIQFPSSINSGDSWTINIPNTQAAGYTTAYNNYQAALQTQAQAITAAQAAVDSAQAALNLKQTAARPEDVATAQAQIQTASASAQNAGNNYNKTSLIAPIDGVITSVDTKVGQTVSGSSIAPGPDVVKMISDKNFQIQTYISEADIGKVKTNDSAKITLDAYGAANIFDAKVLSVDPADTIKDGVNTYKTTLEFNQADDRIKEGMNANIIITGQTNQGSLVIPKNAIFTNAGKTYVLTQTNAKQTGLTAVQTGISSLDGNIEILSGLNEGQMVAYFGK